MTVQVFARKKNMLHFVGWTCVQVLRYCVAKSYVLNFISAVAVVQLHQPHAGFMKL